MADPVCDIDRAEYAGKMDYRKVKGVDMYQHSHLGGVERTYYAADTDTPVYQSFVFQTPDIVSWSEEAPGDDVFDIAALEKQYNVKCGESVHSEPAVQFADPGRPTGGKAHTVQQLITKDANGKETWVDSATKRGRYNSLLYKKLSTISVVTGGKVFMFDVYNPASVYCTSFKYDGDNPADDSRYNPSVLVEQYGLKLMGTQQYKGELVDVYSRTGDTAQVDMLYKHDSNAMVTAITDTFDTFAQWDKEAPTDDSLFDRAALEEKYGIKCPC